MKIIVSPAKNMRVKEEKTTIPYFINNAMEIRDYLRGLNRDSLAKIWKCNDKLLDSNIELLKRIDIENNLTKAIYAYDGLQFKNLNIESLDNDSINYLNDNLYILSAMYGALRANDGVVPYRFDYLSKINFNNYKEMYSYWKSSIFEYISRDDNIIINLASKEYSDSITPYNKNCRIINIIFGSIKNNKLLVKSTESKMMRGRFLRFMALNKIDDVEELKKFSNSGLSYNSILSDENNFVFTS